MRKTASPTIKESVITDHIQYFSGFGYILSKYIRKSDGSIEKDKKGKDKTDGTIAKYPKVWKERNLNIINDACVLQNENEKYNNCCTFTNALLILSFKYALGEALNWTKDDHKPWMLDSITRNTRMDVYNGVISKGIGELYQKVEDGDSVNPDAEPVNWCLVQGYKNAKSSDSWAKGHSFLILDYNKTSDRVLILESNGSNPAIDVYNEANAGNGPRFGKIGHIDLFKNGIRPYSPGSAWYLNSLKTSTWEEIKTKYKYRVLIPEFFTKPEEI